MRFPWPLLQPPGGPYNSAPHGGGSQVNCAPLIVQRRISADGTRRIDHASSWLHGFMALWLYQSAIRLVPDPSPCPRQAISALQPPGAPTVCEVVEARGRGAKASGSDFAFETRKSRRPLITVDVNLIHMRKIRPAARRHHRHRPVAVANSGLATRLFVLIIGRAQ